MPTGYTCDVANGKVERLADYLRACARAFIPDLRDADWGAPLPTASAMKASLVDHYRRMLSEAQERLRTAEAASGAAADLAAAREHTTALAGVRQRNQDRAEVKARYDAMAAAIEAWAPPECLAPLRNFMAEQIRDSVAFDCFQESEPVPMTGAEWRANEIKAAQYSVESGTRDLERQLEMQRLGDAWLSDLHAELAKFEGARPSKAPAIGDDNDR